MRHENKYHSEYIFRTGACKKQNTSRVHDVLLIRTLRLGHSFRYTHGAKEFESAKSRMGYNENTRFSKAKFA